MHFSAETRLTLHLGLMMRAHDRTLREQQALEQTCEEANQQSLPFVNYLAWAKESLHSIICETDGCDLPTEGTRYCDMCAAEKAWDEVVDMESYR